MLPILALVVAANVVSAQPHLGWRGLPSIQLHDADGAWYPLDPTAFPDHSGVRNALDGSPSDHTTSGHTQTTSLPTDIAQQVELETLNPHIFTDTAGPSVDQQPGRLHSSQYSNEASARANEQLMGFQELLSSGEEAHQNGLGPLAYCQDVVQPRKRTATSECEPAPKRARTQARLPSDFGSRASSEMEPNPRDAPNVIVSDLFPATAPVTFSPGSSSETAGRQKSRHQGLSVRKLRRCDPAFAQKGARCLQAFQHIRAQFDLINNGNELRKFGLELNTDGRPVIQIGPYAVDLRDTDTWSAARLHCSQLYMVLCAASNTVAYKVLGTRKSNAITPRLRCLRTCWHDDFRRYMTQCADCLTFHHAGLKCTEKEPCRGPQKECEACREGLRRYEAGLHLRRSVASTVVPPA